MNVLANDSEFPSAGKPSALIGYLLKEICALDIVSDFLPLSKEDFFLVHDPGHVETV